MLKQSDNGCANSKYVSALYLLSLPTHIHMHVSAKPNTWLLPMYVQITFNEM